MEWRRARVARESTAPFQIRSRSRTPVRVLGQPVGARRDPRPSRRRRSRIYEYHRRMISRRAFLGGTALSLITPLALQARQRETLYNGITLGQPWPPQWRFADEH